MLVLLKPTAMSANGGKRSDTERTAHRRQCRIAAVRVASPRDLSPTELPAWLTTAPDARCAHLPDRIANLNQRPTSCAMLRADWSSTHRTVYGTEFVPSLETTVPNCMVYSRNFRFGLGGARPGLKSSNPISTSDNGVRQPRECRGGRVHGDAAPASGVHGGDNPTGSGRCQHSPSGFLTG